MIERLRVYRLDREYEAFTLQQALSSKPGLTEAASLLVISKANVTVSDADYDQMINNLADIREEFNTTPEVIQRALQLSEPSLAQEW